ncbi:protein kinase family protein [Apilactobacillus micheneri]|uniref:protein kinase family protein n=1 Tax=Apilactobacillus micheneri TaxID=1899430 RepID=UPI000D50654E|nr:protein kinase family protein [Apilactobacillus micheneri]GAY79928.1 DNA damage-responsive serine/threonine-protein kinase RqkA [Apilactobacillus micheneri]
MDIDLFFEDQINNLKEIISDDASNFYECKLYNNSMDKRIMYIFVVLQHEMNNLFEFMNEKNMINQHFNADESRELLSLIHIYKECQKYLKDTQYQFKLDNDYVDNLKYVKTFLQYSDGSEIPNDYNEFYVNKYSPIFHIVNGFSISKVSNLKLLGGGGYAQVFKFKDKMYNHFFAIKRLRKGSSDKEKERFYQEFTILKHLNSPYILKVYNFNSESNEYIMEYSKDGTISQFFKDNPNTDVYTRKSIAHQFIRGMRYLHSKGYLHRDISFNNILIFTYDDTTIAKISDLGLVKNPNNDITSNLTSIKGTLVDPSLFNDGFDNYSILNEMYSMTRVIYFIMTNKRICKKFQNDSIKNFVNKGIAENKNNRYKNDDEFLDAFNKVNWG